MVVYVFTMTTDIFTAWFIDTAPHPELTAMRQSPSHRHYFDTESEMLHNLNLMIQQRYPIIAFGHCVDDD